MPLDVVASARSDADSGLTGAEAAERLARLGPNQITGEPPPSVWEVALAQLRDPMNIMLIAVTVVSVVIGQVSTGIIVALLILLNVVLGSRQELKARASIDALASMQVPQARVVRDGSVELVPAARRGARRHRPGRGGRHRPRGRTDHPLGDAGDAGGGADRGERADRQVGDDPGGRGGRAGRSLEHAVPEHGGDPRHGSDGGDRHRRCRRRWVRSRRCCRRSAARARRCRRSSDR